MGGCHAQAVLRYAGCRALAQRCSPKQALTLIVPALPDALTADLCPERAASLWASARAEHGGETPLGLACRMRKLALLEALSAHGVLTARAVLAALHLAQAQQDARAAAEAEAQAHAEAASAADSLQRLHWLRVFGKRSADAEARAAAKLAGAAEPGSPAAVDPAEPPLRADSPLSVLRTKGECCAACCALDESAQSSMEMEFFEGASSDEEEADADLLLPALAALRAAPPKGAAADGHVYLPPTDGEGRLRLFKAGVAVEAAGGGSEGKDGLWSFADADTERGFRTWHSAKLAKVRGWRSASFGRPRPRA